MCHSFFIASSPRSCPLLGHSAPIAAADTTATRGSQMRPGGARTSVVPSSERPGGPMPGGERGARLTWDRAATVVGVLSGALGLVVGLLGLPHDVGAALGSGDTKDA